MPRELTSPYKFGGGALVASGILFVVLAFLDFRAGPPPSNGAEILLWRDSQALVLDFVSELLFFATVLLVPGTVAVYQSLVDVDKTKAATGCGILASTIPVMAMMLIVHGRLIYPIYGMRIDTPEAYAFTAHTAGAVVERVLRGDLEVGFQTAARVYGPEFVLHLADVTREDLE